MIRIFEDKKMKLSGITSLYLSFHYDDEDMQTQIENMVKSCGTYFHHEKSNLWEVPITTLAYLLDNLYYFDDIDLIVNDSEESENQRHISLVYKTNPYQYQKEGIEYGLNHDKWLLLDMPGLGKTLQMIYLAEELKAQDKIEHCLIVCGIASLRDNWRKEILKHSNESCVIIGERITKTGSRVWESVKKRAIQLQNKIDEFFVIINVESLRYEEIIEAYKNSTNKFGLIVLDEAHKCKGWRSQQGVNLLELQAPKQVAMTGTLLLNRPLDAFMPLAWIGVEKKSRMSGKTGISKFKDTFCVYADEIRKERVVGYKNLEVLKDEIDSCSLRRTKDLLDLPEKTIIDEYLTMEPAQQKLYDEIKLSVKDDFNKMWAKADCDKIKLNTNNLLALTTRLQQVTSCPGVLTSQDITSCKLERVVDLVDEITSNGNKVVVLSRFKEPINQLKTLLADFKPLVGTGDGKDYAISKNIDTFQEDDEHKVFLGTIAKMGTGFTLTKASYMIFIDLPWEPGSYDQACDRIHRIGADKKKPVFIYNLLCKDTIDEATQKAITLKKAFSDYMIDDDLSPDVVNLIADYLCDL